MKALSTAIAILLMAAAFLSAGNVAIPDPVGTAPSDDELTYFDGTAWWLSWDGLYRGTWFNTEDFYGVPNDWEHGRTEMWFYHHSSYPWDTSDIYFEVYNGDQTGAAELLDQTRTTAGHYTAVVVECYPTFTTEPDFWLMANTELSSGGWPSILGDNTPNEVNHSFHSDDFIVWQPWIIQGPMANDYWIVAEEILSLESATWGAVKTLF
ncbi:MAG: hypothetical protein R6U36_02830 [Candidatus Fermentibacteraceae bacterium]